VGTSYRAPARAPAPGRLTAAAGVLLACVLTAAACDWRDFDDLKKRVPVAALEPPGDYLAGDDFGPILLAVPLSADNSSAGRFVATGVYHTGVAVFDFDAAGNPKGTGVTGTAYDLLGQEPITALALVPGEKQVLMGAPSPSATFGSLLVMNLDSPFATTTFKNLPEGQFGVGVAAGNFGGAAAPEFVATSANTLHVFIDGQANSDSTYVSAGATDPCPIDFSANLPVLDRANRALIVDMLGTSSMKIAVGTPVATASGGHVAIFDFDATTGAFSCAAVLTGTEAHFGRAMTLVDTDGTGGPDALLVGAPPTHAYLYTLPLTSGQAPVATATDTMGGGSFGAAVAAFDIDGKAGDEIVIGNPDATAGGKTTAGNVSIYKFSGTALTLLTPTMYPNPLAEHDPEAGHGYGSGVIGMRFCPGNVGAGADAGAPTTDAGAAPCTDLPLVGSFSKVFAYYTINSRHTDARAH
jgi:hypothetical protein